MRAVSINGNWARIPGADLARAQNDLDWAYEQAQAAVQNEDGRWFSTDKTWHALDFLLNRHGLDVPIAFGEGLLVDAVNDGSRSSEDANWGSGPAGYLTPENVAKVAAGLADVTEADLIRDVDPAEMEEIYPSVWDDDPGELEWAVHLLPGVKQFFTDAARVGDAVLCWLD